MSIDSSNQIWTRYKHEKEFPEDIILTVKELRQNTFIKRSKVLHLSRDRIDTAALTILTNTFSHDFLVEKLPTIGKSINMEFGTLSYLINALTKQK